MNKIGLGESSEDYLEAMLRLKEKNGYIRSVDIAEHLGVTKPSVSNAIKRLKDKGYIEMNSSSFISLTETGKAIAQKVYERHTTLTNLFVSLGVDEVTASEDACRVEHVISDKTYDALKNIGKK